MRYNLHDTVSFTSGDVPANGKIESIMDPVPGRRAAQIFVRADRPIPIVLGKGTKLEHFCEGGACWIELPGGEVIRDRDDVKIAVVTPD